MTGDYFLVGAVIMGLLSFPSLLGAFTHGRSFLMPILLLVGSGVSLVMTFRYKPEGFGFEEIPDSFIRVIGAFLN
ncbi:hypothetical protein [Actibacterium pelagium]|uniref:Uncharacterized protein n=1 Tax=Actibacterium pelagium TaxID=2029103 RepID=A0A917ALE7_9RHOB|nr:hypothetical protein [Actibacterium pelagium]GGE58922.1 hypothetical protein GCM10011517_28240 [Actibacterium pelagium]